MAYIITHNSPSVGFVSWQDLHMQYNGSTYAIADGNTDKVYVWWELADPYVLKSSNTYPTLGAADALVLLNKNGTAFLVPGSTVLDGSLIVPGTILADALSANSVTGEKILAGAIDTTHLAAYAVTADKIDAEAVTAEKVAANAIGAAAIAAGAILSDHLCAGAVTAGKVAAGAIGATEIAAKAVTVNKLAVVPYNHNPDPFFNDASLWYGFGAWNIVERDTGNVPDLMDVPKAIVLYSTTYSGTAEQGFAGPQIILGGAGQKLRLSATLYNNSNWAVRVGMYYYNAAGTYLDGTALDLAAGGGVSSKSAIGTTPANTAFVRISGHALTNGSAFSGQVAVSNIRVDLAASADLIVDGAVTAVKLAADSVTADKILANSVTAGKIAVGAVGTTELAGIITGTTFRTTADGSGNYMEISGTSLKGKDVDGNVIWELLPNLGPMSVTDDDVSTYEVAINTSTCANEANMGGWSGSVNNPPNTPDGMAQAIAAAKAMYASGTITGKWEITELFATTPRSLLVSVNATTSSSTSARVRVGPITFKPTWQSFPGDPNVGYWTVEFMPAKSAIMTGFPANLTDTRIVVVPVLKLSNKLFIQRSYLFNLPATGTIRILGIFS